MLTRTALARDPADPRYALSFPAHDFASAAASLLAIEEHFAEHGFVVLRDVLSPETCAATQATIWDTIEGEVSGFLRADPSTWKRWKSQFGMPGPLPRFEAQLLRNRQDATLRAVCQHLLGVGDVLVSHDRWALYRPAHARNGEQRELRGSNRWATRANVHLDMNPWFIHDEVGVRAALDALDYDDRRSFILENNLVHRSFGSSIQGVINLRDNVEEDGGFAVVPGFHRIFETWVECGAHTLGLRDWPRKSYPFQQSEGAAHMAQRVPMRAGSVVLWDQRCAHGSMPNRSGNPRMAQFFKMFPATTLSDAQRRKRAAILQQEIDALGFGEELTETGRAVFDVR